jgi:hypothetical protein
MLICGLLHGAFVNIDTKNPQLFISLAIFTQQFLQHTLLSENYVLLRFLRSHHLPLCGCRRKIH